MVPNSVSYAVILAAPEEASLACLRPAGELLESFGIAVRTVVSPASAPCDGVCAIIVASPDAVLPTRLAATGLTVIRVPISAADDDSLRSLHGGGDNLLAGSDEDAFATMAIGEAGAKNAALFVVAFLALRDQRLRAAYADFRARQTEAVLAHPPLVLEA